MNGYGVYLYRSDRPEGPFSPVLPDYRLNGTSRRWVNMWERCFAHEGELLAHNYVYDGYTYEDGNVYLPPIKRLLPHGDSLRLAWWEGNEALRGELLCSCEELTATCPVRRDVFLTDIDELFFSEERLSLPPEGVVIEGSFTLPKNSFTRYSAGGIYLAEDEHNGTAILFDTYGKCEMLSIRDQKILCVDDTVGFGSTAPYAIESGRSYALRILSRHGIFEVYVDGVYMQTFNTSRARGERARPIVGAAAVALRNGCTLSSLRAYAWACE